MNPGAVPSPYNAATRGIRYRPARTAPQIGPETPEQESARAKEEDAGACHGHPGSPRPHAAAQSLYGSPFLGTCQRCGDAQSWLYSVRCDELCIRCIARIAA